MDIKIDLQTAGIRGRLSGDSQLAGMKSRSDAAKEFEALLIGNLLASAFSAEESGLGGADSGADTMLSFGRDHLARVISQAGGLGLSRQLEIGLGVEARDAESEGKKPVDLKQELRRLIP